MIKRLKEITDRFNKFREPECRAEVRNVRDEKIEVEFTGTSAHFSCCFDEHFIDYEYMLEDLLNLKLEIEEIERESDEKFIVKYKKEVNRMASKELLDLLNEAIARELQVAIQYMWQHVLWKGIKGFAVKEELEKIAIEEMKHAEFIAERLSYLGGVPTTKPSPINVGNTLEEMLKQDVNDEVKAIELYKKIIDLAQKEGDYTTARLFRKILEDEEEHHDTFISLLEE